MDMKQVIRLMKDLWDKWDVRGLMLLSLSLQTLLLLLAPLRKRTSNNWVVGGILCLYLLADWAANYAAGVITSSEGSIKNHKDNQPLAFWSTFLLVHLGGPDSITAFALQDNECVSATYIFIQTLPQNQLWLPTLLMFACGFIKYYERTRSLYMASFNNLRDSMRKKPDPGPNYAKMMSVFDPKRRLGLPTCREEIYVKKKAAWVKEINSLTDKQAVLFAYRFFLTFKRLIVDLKCSYSERVRSRQFFLHSSAEEAFRIIALELNFMYDILFTKANIVYTRKGLLLRLFSSALVVTAFGLFYSEEKKFQRSDVCITYALLVGAIALDVIAFIQFFTSYWLTAFANYRDSLNWLIPGVTKPNAVLKKLFFHRWSESVSTHNLIEYSLNLLPLEAREIMDFFGLINYFNGLWYVKREPFTDELRNHIFEEVKLRSELAESSESFPEAITARGGVALRLYNTDMALGDLSHYVDDMEYDESLLSWHIATELCWCWKEEDDDTDILEPELKKKRDISKLLSDYMMYLVVMQPEIMHGVTDIGQTRFRDTCAEVEVVADQKRKHPSSIQFIKNALKACCACLPWFIFSPIVSLMLSLFVVVLLPLLPRHLRYTCCVVLFFTWDEMKERMNKQKKFATKICSVKAEIQPVCLKGDKSKSVLYDGYRLANKLHKLKDRKWEVMSKVWVEMLTYAAVTCRPQALAEQLSKGGELISFVWLLMAHFGLVHQFESYVEFARIKLIVDK